MTSSKIRVGIIGALGRMGQAAVGTVLDHPDLELVMAVARQKAGQDVALAVGRTDECGVPVITNLSQGLADTRPDVVVELTRPDTVFAHVKTLIEHGVRPVIGATGLSDDELKRIEKMILDKSIGGVYAPNFSIGAVLMMQFAQKASQYFSHAEIIEYHHNQKKDAPSGTAIRTAQLMGQANAAFGSSNLKDEKETMAGARGAQLDKGLRIHSVRLPGMLAHQEVIFGEPGQVLTIRHDALDRACFMPGVVLAIQAIASRTGFYVGLEQLMD